MSFFSRLSRRQTKGWGKKEEKTKHRVRQLNFLSNSQEPLCHLIPHARPYLQLQRQGEALCATAEAPGSLSQAVEGRHLILGAQACPGHQRAPTQQHMITTSTKKGMRLWEVRREIHTYICVIRNWHYASSKTKRMDVMSPVKHHCAFGTLCCLLFHLFLFKPGGDREISMLCSTTACLKRLYWGGRKRRTRRKKDSRPEVWSKYKEQWKEMNSTEQDQWVYLLCEKTSSATEGATSRGSQIRSWWISCWAPRVRERNDSWREKQPRCFANTFLIHTHKTR